ncbi:hypothetical protein Tco_1293140 [Tanacetum coccineum]
MTKRNSFEVVGAIVKKTMKPKRMKFVSWHMTQMSEEDDEAEKDEICLMAHDSNEVHLKVKFEADEWIKDSGCSRHMMGNKDIFSTYEAIN